jgi:hypothetical protein
MKSKQLKTASAPKRRLQGVVSRPRAFYMQTPDGNDAHILGDPEMPEATKRALGEMIDAAVKAANSGTLGMPANE